MDQEKPTVLYVDDMSTNLKLFEAALRKDYNVILTEFPLEALKILKEKEVQVLVSDQRMPEMSGTELLEIVANEYPDIRRFLLTAFTDLEMVIEAVNVGKVHGFFKKPMEVWEVRQSIDNSLESYYLKRKNTAILQELEEVNKELRNTGDLKSEIINSINSEIRNPLNRIMGTLNLLKSKTEGDELSEVVRILDQSVVRLEHFNTLTKMITLLNTPGFQVKKEQLSIGQLIQFASIETSEELKDKGLGISWDQETKDLAISGDNGLLVNCIVNLFRFAAEHSDRDGQIKLMVANEDTMLTCCVQDGGMHYSESQQKLLTEHYSLENSRTNLSLGVGLAVSRMIMEAHGGQLVYTIGKENQGCLKLQIPNE